MNPVAKLRSLGYQVRLASGGRIRYALAEGHPEPDPATLADTLADLKAKREEAIAYLRAEAQPASARPKATPLRVADPDRSTFTFTRPDPDGVYRAWRWGQPAPVGRGPTEFDAVWNLWTREDQLDRERAR